MHLATAAADRIPGADISVSPLAWGIFIGVILALLLADLFLFHREAHEISLREAAVSSAVWVAIGVAFTGVVWFWLGGSAAGQYITGYVIEKSLSVDNVFVWAVLFSYFAVPKRYQHRTLFWGIFGALVLRAVFIFAGVALLEAIHWIIYVFGAFLLFTAWRVFGHDTGEVHPEKNPVLRLLRRVIPVTADYHGQKFFVRRNAKRLATPLFVVLVLVESTDVVFAVDSIPAILAVTRSEFIVFSSNAFAILGLRALYFLLSGSADRLVYLNKGLGVILGFVGIKMLLVEVVHLPIWLSLAFIAVVLTITVVASLRAAPRRPPGTPAAAATSTRRGETHHDPRTDRRRRRRLGRRRVGRGAGGRAGRRVGSRGGGGERLRALGLPRQGRAAPRLPSPARRRRGVAAGRVVPCAHRARCDRPVPGGRGRPGVGARRDRRSRGCGPDRRGHPRARRVQGTRPRQRRGRSSRNGRGSR
ncbi:MAG: TerC family protein [Acidimicrobiia bacterium]|nr:TerC family protein [Acidimicrobiia bacterium]